MKRASSSAGVDAIEVLGIVFVVLKLTGKVRWSWWWVTAPFWGPVALVLTVGFLWIAVCTVFDLRSR
jgi:hypothetical protein